MAVRMDGGEGSVGGGGQGGYGPTKQKAPLPHLALLSLTGDEMAPQQTHTHTNTHTILCNSSTTPLIPSGQPGGFRGTALTARRQNGSPHTHFPPCIL